VTQSRKIVLVLGGARSGKSAFAEGLVDASGMSKVYVATGQAFDREMSDRIDVHRARRGTDWDNVEDPFDLSGVLGKVAAPDKAVLIDCLTLWVTNLMMEDRDVLAESNLLTGLLPELSGLIVLVSSEVGMGIVPDNYMARAFRDHAGKLHQQIGAIADEVYFVAAGLPLKMKG
jgi:adenosylcobinamide kinase / adenosylcobinamide-phosphate guanylyltransferase